MFNHEQGIYNDRTINNPSASYSKENMYKIYRIISIKRIIFTQTQCGLVEFYACLSIFTL